MKVEATETRCFKNGRRKQETVGHDNCDVQIQISKCPLFFFTLQAFRCAHFNAVCFRKRMHWRLFQVHAAAGLSRWLRINCDKLMARLNKSGKHAH